MYVILSVTSSYSLIAQKCMQFLIGLTCVPIEAHLLFLL